MKAKQPVTGRQALGQGVAILVERGIEQQTAWREGRMLLGKAWAKKGIDLVVALEDEVKRETLDEFRRLIARRAAREPLQHLLEEQEFMGLSFKVSPAVLIPRWDTETLVYEAMEEAKKMAGPRILDLGIGSGAIAVSLAYYVPAAEVWATDISPEALEVARENAMRLGVERRITFLCGDLFSPLSPETRFDFIVSNPPYLSEEEYMTIEPEVKREPRQALCGGTDGLDYYRRIAASASRHLLPGGRLLLEIGWTQSVAVSKILRENDFPEIKIIKDWGGNDRVIIAENISQNLYKLHKPIQKGK